jgi:tetratricopeptide (TPR) repeat protein
MKTRAYLAVATSVVALAAIAVPAHGFYSDPYQQAEAFAKAGDAAGMEEAYDRILQATPYDRRALIGRATARSWSGNHLAATEDFRTVLNSDPNDLEALTGLGYNYAWSGEYALAETTFQRTRRRAPDNLSVQKGLAYTSLWRGDTKRAERRFIALSNNYPNNSEIMTGLGQVYVAQGRASKARDTFNQSLRLDPAGTGARSGLQAIEGLPPILQANIWVGNSAEGDDIGLRSAELASWITPNTRLGLRYDNSLSLDNPTLSRLGVDAETIYVSAQHQFNRKFIGVAEVGHRDLPNGADQQIYRGEAIFPGEKYIWKAGAQLSPHSDGFDDTLVYGGVNFPINDLVRIDTTFYASETGAAGDEEIRGALYAEYTSPQKWTAGAGVGFGDISSDIPGAGGSVTTANVLFSRPFSKRHRFYVQARYEDAPLNEFTSLMVGVTFNLPRP